MVSIVYATNNLAQFEFKIDTKKQRQVQHNDTRLTKSRNARSKQIPAMPSENGCQESSSVDQNVGKSFRYEISRLVCSVYYLSRKFSCKHVFQGRLIP